MTSAGILSHESFSDLLRGISQRRRQGVLEVSLPSSKSSIYFIAGRIVDITTGSLTPIESVWKRLAQGGYVTGSPKLKHIESYSTFADLLLQNFGVDKDQIQFAIHHRILDELYSLILAPGAVFSMKQEMVEVEKDFAPSISVGQLLLDLVALDSEKDVFDELVQPLDKLEISPHASADGLSTEEKAIALSASIAGTVDELRRRSMLSEYSFRDALTTLLSGGILQPANDKDDLSILPEEPVILKPDDTSGSRLHHDGDDLTIDGATYDSDFEAESQETLELKGSLAAQSARLTGSQYLPHVVLWLFIVLSIAIPSFYWAEMIKIFE